MVDNVSHVVSSGIASLSPEARLTAFREYVTNRNIRLDRVSVFSGFPESSTLMKYIKSGSVFISGESADTLFYSFMIEKLRVDPDTLVVSSSELTKSYLDGPTLKNKHLGIVLGFDLTNNIQEKVMLSFLNSRLGYKALSTTFLYPFTSFRRLETEYGSVFSDAFKAGSLHLVKVK